MKKVDVFIRTRNMYQLNVYLCYIDLLKTNILPIKLVNVKLIDRLSKNWQLIASKNYWLYISIVTKNKPKYIKCDESYRTIICNIRRHKSVVISSGRHFFMIIQLSWGHCIVLFRTHIFLRSSAWKNGNLTSHV